MNLNQWAIKWGVPFEAVEDLRREFGTINTDPVPVENDGSEARIQTLVRLEASQKGCRLFRNNVGVAMDDNGNRTLRYGLANDSKKMNDLVKSSDLIGIQPVLITPAMVGDIIGQFTAREIKPEQWVYTATKHEVAQLNFLELVTSLGGDARFANRVGTL
jgi:hypothetical protein